MTVPILYRWLGVSEVSQSPVVLIVDDEPLLRADIADYLSQRGFGAVEANDGSQAIELHPAHPEISAVFTDIQMSGAIDGFCIAQLDSTEAA